jgi:hypothetical protein
MTESLAAPHVANGNHLERGLGDTSTLAVDAVADWTVHLLSPLCLFNGRPGQDAQAWQSGDRSLLPVALRGALATAMLQAQRRWEFARADLPLSAASDHRVWALGAMHGLAGATLMPMDAVNLKWRWGLRAPMAGPQRAVPCLVAPPGAAVLRLGARLQAAAVPPGTPAPAARAQRLSALAHACNGFYLPQWTSLRERLARRAAWRGASAHARFDVWLEQSQAAMDALDAPAVMASGTGMLLRFGRLIGAPARVVATPARPVRVMSRVSANSHATRPRSEPKTFWALACAQEGAGLSCAPAGWAFVMLSPQTSGRVADAAAASRGPSGPVGYPDGVLAWSTRHGDHG